MIIIGTFEHSLELELLLAGVEKHYIERKSVMVVPMEMDPANPFRLEEKKQALHEKGLETGMACATGCSVIGTSAGFILTWGPVIWGLLAAVTGFGAGFGLSFLTGKRTRRKLPRKSPEVTVLVQCRNGQADQIRDLMWKYRALTVGTIP